jgi:SAM-dependent methyltransferase/uncharacterized protein YbaR (Trm112 family)
MNRKLLEILACPKCKSGLISSNPEADTLDEGILACAACGTEYPVTKSIPRFVEPGNYASSFGYQWNLFRKEQIDSYNGTTLSADRFWAETGWKLEELKDKWVLDAGCGAGRFLDVASVSEGQIVGIDISSAIDAAQENLKGRGNVHFIQASIYELPFRECTFDFCYSIGVIQHTPEPERSLRSIAAQVMPEGKIAVTIYERRKWFTMLFTKYWLRPITKRMKKETLLNLVKGVMPVAFPVTDVLFRFPILGKVFMFMIPVANYVREKQLNREQRYAWAVLDTFDMLSPQFDRQLTENEARKALVESEIDVKRQSFAGLNLVGKRR